MNRVLLAALASLALSATGLLAQDYARAELEARQQAEARAKWQDELDRGVIDRETFERRMKRLGGSTARTEATRTYRTFHPGTYESGYYPRRVYREEPRPRYRRPRYYGSAPYYRRSPGVGFGIGFGGSPVRGGILNDPFYDPWGYGPWGNYGFNYPYYRRGWGGSGLGFSFGW